MTELYKNINDYVLYFHRNMETKEIFYVGIGSLQRANNLTNRNRLWKNYVNKYGKPIVEINKTNLNCLEAQYLENFFITKIGRKIDNTGILTNVSMGGEAARGYKHTKEHRQKIEESRKAKGVNYLRGEDNWAYGRVVTDEERKRVGSFFKGTKQTDEHIKKRTFHRRGIKSSQESIDKMAAALTGRKLPQSVKDKIGVASKKNWDSKEYREKYSISNKGKVRNSRKVINLDTGYIYNSAKEAAIAANITIGYFTGMMGGVFKNKTNFTYLEPRN